MRQKYSNPISSTGYYFSQTLNLAPGENMDVNLLTKKEAQDILKSDVVNNLDPEDFKIIQKIAETPEITIPFPTRTGQVLISESVDDRIKLVWRDLRQIPNQSQIFPVAKLSEQLFSKYVNCKYIERQPEHNLYAEVVKTGPDNLFYIATSDLVECTLTLLFDGTPLIIAGSKIDDLEKHLADTSNGYVEVKTNELFRKIDKVYKYDFNMNPGDLLSISDAGYAYEVKNSQGQVFPTPFNDVDYLLIGTTSGQSIKLIDCGIPTYAEA